MLSNTDQGFHMCGCIGPQNGDKYCPCEMRSRGLERKTFSQPITPAEKAKLSAMFNKEIR